MPGTAPSIELRSERAIRRVRCVHVITDLETGGAEMMLWKLVSRMDRARFETTVVSLTPVGPVGERIRDAGIDVQSLGMRRAGLPDLRGLWRLWRLLKRLSPALVQTWLYHADLLGLVASRLAGVPHAVWNVRGTELEFQHYRPWTRWTVGLNARLSHLPDRIVVNSEAGCRSHAAIGYDVSRMIVIPNGFDTERFKPDAAVRTRVRTSWGLREPAVVIGQVARFDPQKDYRTLITAAARVASRHAEVMFVFAGEGVTWERSELTGWIRQAGLPVERVRLLGRRDDVPALLAGLDIVVLSSAYGEGCPNIIGEAMASGLVCVATDVGDTARLLGPFGRIVPPRNPEALAAAWEALMAAGPEYRQAMGTAARERILQEYPLARTIRSFELLYETVTARNGGHR